MLIRNGHIALKNVKNSMKPSAGCDSPISCFMCKKYVAIPDRTKCLSDECQLNCHLICLSQRFLQPGEYVPISGSCPKCRQMMLWADIIRKYKGHADAIAVIDDN